MAGAGKSGFGTRYTLKHMPVLYLEMLNHVATKLFFCKRLDGVVHEMLRV